jgi:hypothetical protein
MAFLDCRSWPAARNLSHYTARFRIRQGANFFEVAKQIPANGSVEVSWFHVVLSRSRQEQLNLIAVMISSVSKSLSGSGSKWEAEGTASPDIDPDPDFDFDTAKPPPLIQNDLREPVLRSEGSFSSHALA